MTKSELIIDPELSVDTEPNADLEPAASFRNIDSNDESIRYETYVENCCKYYWAPIRKLRKFFNASDDDFNLSVSHRWNHFGSMLIEKLKLNCWVRSITFQALSALSWLWTYSFKNHRLQKLRKLMRMLASRVMDRIHWFRIWNR